LDPCLRGGEEEGKGMGREGDGKGMRRKRRKEGGTKEGRENFIPH